jgi:ABC-type Zn uptake system ZnuABC Zn-binding protein ZnuA
MKKNLLLCFLFIFLSACQPASSAKPATGSTVLAVDAILGEVVQRIAGEHFPVEVLMSHGTDPHNFQPSAEDLGRIARSGVIVVHGGNMEAWLAQTLKDAGGSHLVLTASQGISGRADPSGAFDPHFWLDPLLMIQYTEHLRDEFIAIDPQNEADYTRAGNIYVVLLTQLNAWIEGEVAKISPQNRLLVTQHESLGYFAERYGFEVVGTILPSISNNGVPSEQHLSALIETIRQRQVKAIFLEVGDNPAYAEQIAAETGVQVVTGLYLHSLTLPGEPAPTYIEMMKLNVRLMTQALK